MRLNLFNYLGGKNYMLKEIIPRLDYSKICYIELFGGSGKVLLNKPPHKIEIFNDYKFEIYNLFKTVKENYEEFIKRLENLIYMEQLFYDFIKSNPTNSLELAVKTLYEFNTSFNGKRTSFSYGFVKNKAKQFQAAIKQMPLISERIKNVTFLNRDYKKILHSIRNLQNIMLYADPPYYGKEYLYGKLFKKEDHYILADYLNKAKYSVMISYYYFPDIEKLYPPKKWIYIEKTVRLYSTYKRDEKREAAQELLILNYKPKEVM